MSRVADIVFRGLSVCPLCNARKSYVTYEVESDDMRQCWLECRVCKASVGCTLEGAGNVFEPDTMIANRLLNNLLLGEQACMPCDDCGECE